MTTDVDTIRQLIADVLSKELTFGWAGNNPLSVQLADALLADSTLAAIIDLAAWALEYHNDEVPLSMPMVPAEPTDLLADWRTNR